LLMSTPMILAAPAVLQPMTADRPMPPRPNTAQVEPLVTCIFRNTKMIVRKYPWSIKCHCQTLSAIRSYLDLRSTSVKVSFDYNCFMFKQEGLNYISGPQTLLHINLIWRVLQSSKVQVTAHDNWIRISAGRVPSLGHSKGKPRLRMSGLGDFWALNVSTRTFLKMFLLRS
jgi:hypothetical protein